VLNGLIAPVMTEKSHAALEQGIRVFCMASVLDALMYRLQRSAAPC
jgi:hypothetical protein